MPDNIRDADLYGPLTEPLTRSQLRTRVTNIVHAAFPLPHNENCLRFADMVRVLVDLAEQVATGRTAEPDGEPLFTDHHDVPQVCLHPALVDAFGTWLAARGMFLFRIPNPGQLPTYGIGVTDARANLAAREVTCTGLTASWCPRCGSCLCRPPHDGDRSAALADPVCGLHGDGSSHGEPAPAGAGRVVFADEGRQWLRLATDAHARAVWMSAAGLGSDARPDEVLAAVGRAYTLYGMFIDAPAPAG